MSVGTYISVLGHVGLIGWVLVDGVFAPRDPAPLPQTTEVAVISAEVFDIMMNNTPPDVGMIDDATVPELAIDPAPDLSTDSDPAPTQADVSQTTPADSDPLPSERPERLATPQLVQDAPVAAPAPAVEPAPRNPVEISERPQMRAEDRVAPSAAPPPPPDVDIGAVLRDAVQPADEPAEAVIEPAEPAQAPEAASEVIVTEAQEAEVTSAPVAAVRPQLRPADLGATPQSAAPARTQAAVPDPQPDPEPEPEPTPAVDPVTALLEQALADAEAQRIAAAAAQPQTLSIADSQGLTLAIGFCWNSGSLSTEALQTTVTVDVEFTNDGRPLRESIRLHDYQGGNRVSAARAFEAAKRAILECGQTGYDLPENIYEVWRYMRLDFNPENMRIK